jgi:hypothetical protein
MLVTVGDPDSLILTLAVVARSRRGTLDTAPPGRGARLVIGQQAIAFAFERFSYTMGDLRETLRFSPLFRPLTDDIHATVAHLTATGWLAAGGPDNDVLTLGPLGHNRFGGSGLRKLLATFVGSNEASVVADTGRAVGSLDWAQVIDGQGKLRTGPVTLGGERWRLTDVDRHAGIVTAVAISDTTEAGRVPSWRGPSREVARATWEAVREILTATKVPGIAMDKRAEQWLGEQKAAWAPRLVDPVRADGGHTIVDAFGGVAVHRAVLAALDMEGSAEGPTCHITAPLEAVVDEARRLLEELEKVYAAEAVLQSTKIVIRNPELVAPSVLLAEANEYYVDRVGISRTISLIATAGHQRRD